MTEPMTSVRVPTAARTAMNKVPEVTAWFWIIKILCTTVGESFADWINMAVGLGLVTTSVVFTGVLAVVLGWQVRQDRYRPVPYWLTVVVVSITGTLYTDILTDNLHVPLAFSTTVFAVALAAVFAGWYARERTLSIHDITGRRREGFYWLAVLVTFALGTAAGDWTLEATGWGPGTSVLLPAALIVAVVVGWRLGGNAVLSFWLAYILTRPLGANLGDWLATPSADHGLGLGAALTSGLFVTAIVATVVHLAVTRADVADDRRHSAGDAGGRARRERVVLGYFGVVAIATALLLGWSAARPHPSPQSEEGAAGAGPVVVEPPADGVRKFPSAPLARLRSLTQDVLATVTAGDRAAAVTRVAELETAWDDDQDALRPLDPTAWTFVDGRIDTVLTAVRAASPDLAVEQRALAALLAALT